MAEKEFEDTVSNVSIDPKSIFSETLRNDLETFILCNRHLSSRSNFTRELIESSEKLGLDVLDQVIGGKSCEYGFFH